MIRKYSLVMESGPDRISGYIPELPSILITGSSVEELTTRDSEAIKVYRDVIAAECSPTSELREIEVEVPV